MAIKSCYFPPKIGNSSVQDWQRALHLLSTLAEWRVEANLITFSALGLGLWMALG